MFFEQGSSQFLQFSRTAYHFLRTMMDMFKRLFHFSAQRTILQAIKFSVTWWLLIMVAPVLLSGILVNLVLFIWYGSFTWEYQLGYDAGYTIGKLTNVSFPFILVLLIIHRKHRWGNLQSLLFLGGAFALSFLTFSIGGALSVALALFPVAGMTMQKQNKRS